MTYNNDSGMGSTQDQNKKNDQGSQPTNIDSGSDNSNRTDRGRDNTSTESK